MEYIASMPRSELSKLDSSEDLARLNRSRASVAHIDEAIERPQQLSRKGFRKLGVSLREALNEARDPCWHERAIPALRPGYALQDHL